MAAFLGTSTTNSAGHLADAVNLEESQGQDTSSATCIMGIILFSGVFTCGFVLAWCQLKGAAKKSRVSLVLTPASEDDASSIVRADGPQPAIKPAVFDGVEIVTAGPELAASGHANPPTVALMVDLPVNWQKAASCPVSFAAKPVLGQPPSLAAIGLAVAKSDVRMPGQLDVETLRCTATGDNIGFQEHPYADDNAALGGWVGSLEWAAARAARKKRLQSGIFFKSWHKTPRTPATPPPSVPAAPATPAPRLHLLPMDAINAEVCEGVPQASAGVHEQLTRTATEDVQQRRNKFRALCARWHPDKNLSEERDLATQVFQYLQAQKEWYLLE